MGICVQGEACGEVPQYAGHCLDVHTILQGNGCEGVAEIMEEILMGGLLNMNMTDFYRHYGDEDSEESMEEVAADGTSQTEELYLRIEKTEKVMSTFETLNYRERAIVADHLGFCRECYAAHYFDTDDLDEDGKPKRKPRRKVPFIELAVEHGLPSLL